MNVAVNLNSDESMPHVNSFNLIRLLAALQVLIVHACNHFGIIGWGITFLKLFPGVPIFFFISGLMICGSYERSLLKTGSFTTYFKNRFLRIFPALWVCVLLSLLSVILVNYLDVTLVGLKSIIVWTAAQMSIVQFYNPDFMRAYGVGSLNGALWTISVELQFYLFAPFVYLLVTKHKKLAVSIFLVSLFVNVWVHNFVGDSSSLSKMVRVTFAPWIFYFMFGFFVAKYQKINMFLVKLPFLSILPLYFISMYFVANYQQNSSNSINPVSAILLAVLIFKIGSSRYLSNYKISRWTDKNDYSYGIYLYHMPLINLILFLGVTTALASALLACGGALVLGVLSWYLVERPCLKLKLLTR